MTQYWGGTKHFFLLILYNFKNIGGGGGWLLPLLCRPCCSCRNSREQNRLVLVGVTDGALNVMAKRIKSFKGFNASKEETDDSGSSDTVNRESDL